MELKKINFQNIIYITMFAYFKGKIIEKNLNCNTAIIDVNNIGYLVEIPKTTLIKINQGEDYKIHVVAINNEEGIRLFGFLNKTEKELFQLLIKVSGIGPKSAVNILSYFEVEQFISAVIRGDVKLIEEAQGVGNKTAQRIILELKNKFKNIIVSKDNKEGDENHSYKSHNDVSSILSNLGLSYLEIDKKLNAAREQEIPDEAESLIRFCLQN